MSLSRLLPKAGWVKDAIDQLRQVNDNVTSLGAGPLGEYMEHRHVAPARKDVHVMNSGGGVSVPNASDETLSLQAPIRAEGAIGGENIFGAPVLSVHNPEELREGLVRAFRQDGPVVVEAMIDSNEYDDLVLREDRP